MEAHAGHEVAWLLERDRPREVDGAAVRAELGALEPVPRRRVVGFLFSRKLGPVPERRREEDPHQTERALH